MGLIKWVVAAAIGAIVGAAVWVGVEFFMGRDFNWLAIVVGVTAGLAVRAVSAGSPVSYLRGAITVAMALAAIVGARFALAEIMLANVAQADVPLVTARLLDDAAEEGDGAGSDGVVPDEPVQISGEVEFPTVTPRSIPSMSDSFAWIDWLWFALAGLIAYELGRGGEKRVVVVPDEPEASPDSEPPPANEDGVE